MVNVDMNSTPLKVIGREACLWIKNLSWLSKDPGPKKHPNTLWREESKEIKDFMKVEDGVVRCKKYDGRCMKQRIKIPKATWTSPILRRRSTCWASSCRVFFYEGWCENYCAQWNPQDSNSFGWGGKLGWGVEVWCQAKRWPCNAFLRLDGKNYCTKFGLEVFISRWYN